MDSQKGEWADYRHKHCLKCNRVYLVKYLTSISVRIPGWSGRGRRYLCRACEDTLSQAERYEYFGWRGRARSKDAVEDDSGAEAVKLARARLRACKSPGELLAVHEALQQEDPVRAADPERLDARYIADLIRSSRVRGRPTDDAAPAGADPHG